MYRKLGNITQNGDEISLQYDSSQNSKDHPCHTQHKVITVIKYVAKKKYHLNKVNICSLQLAFICTYIHEGLQNSIQNCVFQEIKTTRWLCYM
jgi:hypothetical protein